MHTQIQKRFFDIITAKEPLYASKNNPIQTYKEMIHYRFKEVILSAFPRFLALLDAEILDKLITTFISNEPQSPYIWQMPNEFRAFLATTDLKKSYPFMEDLLWFEWIEIEIFMRPFQRRAAISFSWDTPLSLSHSALAHFLEFPSFNDEDLEIQGNYAVLLYYNFDENVVHFQEITPFMCQFLNLLQEHLPLVALDIISLEYDIDTKEVKELLQEPLEHFAALHVLTQR